MTAETLTKECFIFHSYKNNLHNVIKADPFHLLCFFFNFFFLTVFSYKTAYT